MNDSLHVQVRNLIGIAARAHELLSCLLMGVKVAMVDDESQRHYGHGEDDESLNVYRRCRDMLSIVLSTKPAAETEAIRSTLAGGASARATGNTTENSLP